MTEVDVLLPLVRGAVDARLEHVLARLRAQWPAPSTAADELFDAAATALTGGKRMRAVLGAVGLALLNEDHAGSVDQVSRERHDSSGTADRVAVLAGPTAARLGAALELYQASALVHDDVIDAADTRRGLPSAHRRYASRHRQAGWRGSAEGYGVSAAILLGDLLMSASATEMGAAAATAERGAARAARDAFDAMTTEVAVGQFLDVHHEVLPLPDPTDHPVAAGTAMREAALEVVRHKSARYSVMYPLVVGALLAGVDPRSELLEALKVFGEEIGIAFQLRDDVLGVFGDPALTGKPAGDDLREGKRTVLLALTWQRCNDAGRALLTRVLTQGAAASAADVAATADIIRDCGALAAHEEEIAAHTATGLGALDAVPSALSDAPRETLTALAHLLTARRS
ncbi:polyprenyl synthetase family protein [Actinomyces ruminicola]|uniref:Geranylgeranyl diphosphate synthase, type I n=1 Tax=Actinomyces ruminicola TaxID=332524 RepID=A0A1G9VS54_9ACTO|nr:polyprenyl synthetase family protein [Actinomyces ruminicola]SDM74943.1 geranylgeranyl diphosphate synthase, type I [Actinomyces ruminicola]